MSSFSERHLLPSYQDREVLVKCPSCGQIRVATVNGGYCSQCQTKESGLGAPSIEAPQQKDKQ